MLGVIMNFLSAAKPISIKLRGTIYSTSMYNLQIHVHSNAARLNNKYREFFFW
jgi:hypothetical protein